MGKLADLKLPLILISEIILCLLWGDRVSTEIKSALYAVSLSIKEALLMVLPFIIFSFLLSSIGTLKKGAFSFVVIAFLMVILSNFTATSLAGFLGIFTLNALDSIQAFTPSTLDLLPLWDLDFPSFLSNDTALFLGLLCGILVSLTGSQKGQNLARYLQHYALLFLKRLFIPVIPVFVLGFILKMQHDGILTLIVQNYLSVFVAITFLSFSYIIFLYGLSAHFNPSKWLTGIRNMLPALVTGFSTMSSASALPLITTASEKTSKNPVVNGIVPLSINIHMIGDCFSLSILALAIMVSFGHPLPDTSTFLTFVFFFVIARFSVAAVPGGGVLVVLPVLESALGFSPEMLSLILALYILFDPVATSANVFGNGAFALLFEKVYTGFHKSFYKKASSQQGRQTP
ncbi:MAG: dicarboxylate/amino acid:cation symporter [Alphaproteobacteria bacterium]|nr:dicarboxylate/amino acid:cation symporter [Alphaproteobacteria bacterium]NCQ66254.1 dicarboxylate/amino acid:cation symporter [Alphaproteobacteria bacterium]NCT06602.1 dicarboxylate/amino acid:cation symporter [Alphaproteobacteria bacterium]